MIDDPFWALGLPARGDLSDEDVRAAWRRIAAATHPDRDDGGDAGRFGAAAAAYDLLRTSFGRGEALADLGLAGSAPRVARRAARHARRSGAARTGASGRGRRQPAHRAPGPAVLAGTRGGGSERRTPVLAGADGCGSERRARVLAGAGPGRRTPVPAGAGGGSRCGPAPSPA